MFNNEFIYLIGGFNGTSLNDIDKYVIAEDKWDGRLNTSNEKFMGRLVPLVYQVSKTFIFIAGGNTNENDLKDACYYDDTVKGLRFGMQEMPSEACFYNPSV